MSDDPKPSASSLGNLQLLLAESEDSPAFASSTATTVIVKATSIDEPCKEIEDEFAGEKDFCFEDFVKEHPELRWPGDGDEGPVAAAMSPAYSSNSSISDASLRMLLEPPPSLSSFELQRPSVTLPSVHPDQDEGTVAAAMSPAYSSISSISDASLRMLLEPPPSLSSSELQRPSVTLPSVHPDQEDYPRSGLGDLDAKSALFLARHASPLLMQKHPKVYPHSTAINPSALGGEVVQRVLEEDARKVGRARRRKRCVCSVSRHPSGWSVSHIQDVHNYSFLLDCQGLVIDEKLMVASYKKGSVAVYNIPMAENNPIKLKAEHVLKFVDVELGFGDQTCYDDLTLHYAQPSDRKILIVVCLQRVVGIVVAEEVLLAHRVLRETTSYMELEEDPVPVRVGINRLWVHISMRRKHLATELCNLIGTCFYEDETLEKEDYAFNINSNAMVLFAKIYLNTLRPPLYCRLW